MWCASHAETLAVPRVNVRYSELPNRKVERAKWRNPHHKHHPETARVCMAMGGKSKTSGQRLYLGHRVQEEVHYAMLGIENDPPRAANVLRRNVSNAIGQRESSREPHVCIISRWRSWLALFYIHDPCDFEK